MIKNDSSTYKEIKFGASAEPVIVDISDEPIVQDKVEGQEVVQEAVVKAERKPHRSEKRIKDLVAKNHEAEARALQAEQKAAELEKRLLAGNVQGQEALKQRLEGAITSLHVQLTAAHNSGDNEALVRLQDELMTAKIELKDLSTDLKDNYQAVEQAKQRPESPRPVQVQAVPERATEWIEEHPEFKTDELFYNASLVINNQLLREEFDPNSEEFYEELSARLSPRFPEVFGVAQENSVSYKKVDDSPEAEGVKQAAPVQKTQKARTTEQVVSGSSRPSANVIQKKHSTEVTLSAQDVEQANIWGLDLKQMARRIAHSENNKRTDGYVPISIPKQ